MVEILHPGVSTSWSFTWPTTHFTQRFCLFLQICKSPLPPTDVHATYSRENRSYQICLTSTFYQHRACTHQHLPFPLCLCFMLDDIYGFFIKQGHLLLLYILTFYWFFYTLSLSIGSFPSESQAAFKPLSQKKTSGWPIPLQQSASPLLSSFSTKHVFKFLTSFPSSSSPLKPSKSGFFPQHFIKIHHSFCKSHLSCC